jgi:hypothetical protein
MFVIHRRPRLIFVDIAQFGFCQGSLLVSPNPYILTSYLPSVKMSKSESILQSFRTSNFEVEIKMTLQRWNL